METKRKISSPILWVEGAGFSIIIALSWLTEAVRLPHLIYGETFTPNWNRAILRTVVIALVWICVHRATCRLLRRLYYLEEFLLVCSWCRKVCHNGEWQTMEKYFDAKFATQTSHGMCPDCVEKETPNFS